MSTPENTVVAETIEAPKAAATESLTDKGSERYTQLSSAISNATAKARGWVSTGASAMGRMFKKTAVGVLAAPEVAARGAEVANEKLNQASEYVFDQAGAFDAWRGEKAEEIGAWKNEKVAQAKEFVSTKKEQVSAFATEKLALAGAFASLAANRTREGLRSAKEAIGSRFTKIAEFGRNSIDAAVLKRHEVRFEYHAKMQEKMHAAWENRKDQQEARLKTKGKLGAYKKFNESTTIALPKVQYTYSAAA